MEGVVNGKLRLHNRRADDDEIKKRYGERAQVSSKS